MQKPKKYLVQKVGLELKIVEAWVQVQQDIMTTGLKVVVKGFCSELVSKGIGRQQYISWIV